VKSHSRQPWPNVIESRGCYRRGGKLFPVHNGLQPGVDKLAANPAADGISEWFSPNDWLRGAADRQNLAATPARFFRRISSPGASRTHWFELSSICHAVAK
jgi:hypothetical protein